MSPSRPLSEGSQKIFQHSGSTLVASYSHGGDSSAYTVAGGAPMINLILH